MDGTIHSTRDRAGLTGGVPGAGLRLAGLLLTALVGAGLVMWVNRTTWDRVEWLQQEFGNLKAESFYSGVRIRSDIQHLNDILLRYRLNEGTNDHHLFLTEARKLRIWLDQSREDRHASRLEKQFFEQVSGAYSNYLADSVVLLESNGPWYRTKSREFRDNYQTVETQSSRVLFLCDTFIQDQRAAFDSFLLESQNTLTAFQRLLDASVILLLSLAAALVVMVYRGMIEPLRNKLTESEAIIARQEKLASLGVLAAGVAHEIRNPLTAIKFRLFSLNKSLKDGGANEDASVIGSEITRLERIVKDFLEFARPSDPELVALPADRILHDVCDLMKSQLAKRGIELRLETSKPAWVRADSQQVKQVLINLIQNAADSIARKGAITLRVRETAGFHRKTPAGMVALDVSDTGKGIPLEVQQRLFDPFFTTKEGGTGLGLSIAARIIEKHGGELIYDTEVNKGTTFSIVLPRSGDHETKNPAD